MRTAGNILAFIAMFFANLSCAAQILDLTSVPCTVPNLIYAAIGSAVLAAICLFVIVKIVERD